MLKTPAYAAMAAKTPLAPFSIDRREPGPQEVLIDILYCGVCHTDIHQVADDWGGALFPMVPGHEIVGKVEKVGAEVQKWRAGDIVGVGASWIPAAGAKPAKAVKNSTARKARHLRTMQSSAMV